MNNYNEKFSIKTNQFSSKSSSQSCKRKSPCVCCITGPTGPTGPTGQTGPTGPTGPTGSAGLGSTLAGIQVQLQTGEFSTIADGAPVLFNVVLFNETSAISYDPVTGIFTINVPGVYYFDFWVAMDGAATSPTIAYELSGSEGTSVYVASASVTDLISGNALVNVTSVPATFRLLNQSGDTAFIPNLIAQANMSIVHLEQ